MRNSAGRPVVILLPVVLELPQKWTATWDFAVPGLADRPVQDVLELVYSQLADSVLPTAEQLL